MKITKTLSLFAFILMLSSCIKEGAKVEFHYYEEGDYETISKHLNIDAFPEDYTLKFPDYYRGGVTRSFQNGVATLGRVLFYDTNLSKDNTISCASCHKQELAFSDDKAFSDGVSNRSTARNSLALGSTFNFNEYYGNPTFGGIPFFWDNRAFTVSEQAKATLGNPKEMDMHMDEVVARIKNLEYYKPLFDKEFYGQINENNVLFAISEFVNSIGSFQSKFDKALTAHFKKYKNTNNLENYNFEGFTDAENNGKNIYMRNCASCHGETMGVPATDKANNGLYLQYEDKGVGGNTYISSEISQFKVPTLRNITLTAPYMHDGSLATLEEVIEHYNNGIKNHVNLSKELKEGSGPKRLNLSQNEKEDLLAFFSTLEDPSLMKEKKYSNPFK